MNKFKVVRKASILGIIGNFFLFGIKSVIGFITGSQAMIADSFNSLSDIFSSLMTFIGNKVASKPKDEDHNLGHGKAEYIYSMFISIMMFFLGGKLLIDSISALIFHEKYVFSIWLIVVCIMTILVKLSLYLYTKIASKKYSNLLLEANSKDHRNDCIITVFNLVSSLLSLKGIFFVDAIVGMGIAIWIIITAYDIFGKSYDVLMDKSIDEETKKRVLDIIECHKEVYKINHFNSTPVGYQYQISFTIFVDGKLSTFKSHAIADALEDEIGEKIPEIYLTVIHVNPIKVDKKSKKSI